MKKLLCCALTGLVLMACKDEKKAVQDPNACLSVQVVTYNHACISTVQLLDSTQAPALWKESASPIPGQAHQIGIYLDSNATWQTGQPVKIDIVGKVKYLDCFAAISFAGEPNVMHAKPATCK
ncbi:hypothetical protein LX64_03083 [Chitinophaga skermanii]|uniref:Lipoprotein n=1 Tax=Chitinophaga skermanii TaxID=331697 RepID=A0A327QK00_9BACT|nr:hypothetical protein [Chitinophaga skermanii]RAJ04205.1 hypothetical protein LX64_03083 [Chitinophaga skermanii]